MRRLALRWGMLGMLAATWAIISYNLSHIIDSPFKILAFCMLETAWSAAGAYIVFQATKEKGGKNGR